MLIAGAGGHAREIIDVFGILKEENIYLYENVADSTRSDVLGFKILNNEEDIRQIFKEDPRFVLGVGNPYVRHKMNSALQNFGGKLHSLISPLASISVYNAYLGAGINIMSFALISNNVRIDEGALVNCRVNIHHDVIVGQYCEISPGAVLLGGAKVGEFSCIGSGAIILPKVTVGKNCVIGAGAVVTTNIPDNSTAVGTPAKVIKQNNL